MAKLLYFILQGASACSNVYVFADHPAFSCTSFYSPSPISLLFTIPNNIWTCWGGEKESVWLAEVYYSSENFHFLYC